MLARLLGNDTKSKKKIKSRILRDYTVLVFDWKGTIQGGAALSFFPRFALLVFMACGVAHKRRYVLCVLTGESLVVKRKKHHKRKKWSQTAPSNEQHTKALRERCATEALAGQLPKVDDLSAKLAESEAEYQQLQPRCERRVVEGSGRRSHVPLRDAALPPSTSCAGFCVASWASSRSRSESAWCRCILMSFCTSRWRACGAVVRARFLTTFFFTVVFRAA